MNDQKHLILIKGEDKTSSILKLYYSEGKYNITFNNEREYAYGFSNVEWHRDPEIVDVTQNEVTVSGEYVYNVKNILYFGQYAKLITVDGRSRIHSSRKVEVHLKRAGKSKDVLKYLKEISSIMKYKVDDDSSYLGRQYERIDEVTENTVLPFYLYKRDLLKRRGLETIILPFGFNISQESAVRESFRSNLSIIEGPPGTGKTQTILNIIANAIIEDKSIAVVSNNNSATVNVQEKLEKNGLGFISSFLGSKENIKTFIENQEGVIPDLSKWKLSKHEVKSLMMTLRSDLDYLLDINEAINEKAILTTKLKEIKNEYRHFWNDFKYERLKADGKLLKMNHSRITEMIDFISYDELPTFVRKILFLVKYKMPISKIYSTSLERTVIRLQHIYYLSRIGELKRSIDEITEKIGISDFSQKMEKYQEDSLKILMAKLYNKFSDKLTRKEYSVDDIYYRFESFVEEYPVVLSTTHSLRNISSMPFVYDLLIMDEASQVDVVSGSLALSVAQNAVIVGDEKQLPHVVTSEMKKNVAIINEMFSIENEYGYENSILSSLKKLYKSEINTTLLREHYRCSPSIINYCNKKFYDSKLIVHTVDNEDALEVYISAEGNHARGRVNQRQVDIIQQEVLPTIFNGSIGVITPFRDQADLLMSSFVDVDVDADTVHKYQGRERDVVILSTVSNEIDPGSFVDDRNLLNVAVSRAKSKLILVTSFESQNQKTNISDLMGYIKYNNFEIKDSNVFSIFDTLYKNHSDKILDKFRNPKRVSEYHSENAAYTLITEILNEDQFSELDVILHYPFNKIIKNMDILDSSQKKYASNNLTHVDFMIFNKLTKEPVLVVEVDGYSYHNLNKKQLQRDEMKDKILELYSINYLRLNTTGSNESNRVKSALLVT